MEKRDWKVLLSSMIIVYAVAFIGSIFTGTETSGAWYQSIRPSITPPSYVFPIVWNVLFFLIGLSMYYCWTNAKKSQKNSVVSVYGLNLILNLFWSIIFFGMRDPKLAFFEVILFWISILLMMHVSYKISKKSSYLLWPYFIWVTFASVLNFLSIR